MKNLFVILIVLITSNTYAQSFPYQNSIVLETNLIGTLSFSYDRIIPIKERSALMIGGDYKMGIGFGGGSHWLAPEISLLSFGPKHFMETGLLYVIDIEKDDEEEDNNSSPGVRIAYRLQGKKGFTFRATANVLFNFDPPILPEVGIGYSF